MIAALRHQVALLRSDLMAFRLQSFGPRPRITELADRTVSTLNWTGPNALQSGSYGPSGAVDPESLLWRRYHPRIPHTLGKAHHPAPVATDTIEVAIYGGPLFSAFGHFVTEGIARTWAADKIAGIPILFSGANTPDMRAFTPWQHEVFDLLGVADRARLITEPLAVRKLFVPAPGYVIQYQFAHHHAAYLGRIPWARDPNGPKVWVSRTGIEPSATQGTVDLEAALACDGWHILHPQRVPVAEQLQTYASASRIAAEQGSALHGLVFLKAARGLRVDIFARDPGLSIRDMNANQATIAWRLGLDMRVHSVPGEQIISRKGPMVQKTYAPPGRYLERLAK